MCVVAVVTKENGAVMSGVCSMVSMASPCLRMRVAPLGRKLGEADHITSAPLLDADMNVSLLMIAGAPRWPFGSTATAVVPFSSRKPM